MKTPALILALLLVGGMFLPFARGAEPLPELLATGTRLVANPADVAALEQLHRLAPTCPDPETAELAQITSILGMYAAHNEARGAEWLDAFRRKYGRAEAKERFDFFQDCPTCAGKGKLPRNCEKCKGSGRCNMCHGAGKTVRLGRAKSAPQDPCTFCHATGKCKLCEGAGKQFTACTDCDGRGRLPVEKKKQDCYAAALKDLNDALADLGPGAGKKPSVAPSPADDKPEGEDVVVGTTVPPPAPPVPSAPAATPPTPEPAAPAGITPSTGPAVALPAALAAKRPRPGDIDFFRVQKDLQAYLLALPPLHQPSERDRIKIISTIRPDLINLTKTPFESYDEGIVLRDGQRVKGSVMANENEILVHPKRGKKFKRVRWGDLAFEQYPAFLEYYIDMRIDLANPAAAGGGKSVATGGDGSTLKEVGREYFRLALLCDWYGKPADAARYTQKAVAKDASLAARIAELLPAPAAAPGAGAPAPVPAPGAAAAPGSVPPGTPPATTPATPTVPIAGK